MVSQKQMIFSTCISTGKFQDFVDQILRFPETANSSYVVFANVHMIVECYKNKETCAAVNNADLVAPDGKPLSVFLNVFQGLDQEKISGPDLFPILLEQAALRGLTVFFYGSTNAILEKVALRAQKEFPNLKIAGTYAPPFRPLNEDENQAIIKVINQASPHFVFVALGCPKQEKWMAENNHKIHSCMLGVGQALLVYAGELKRAPKWLQNLGFEWAYRLCSEPRRLWRRYLQTNTIFILLTLHYAIQKLTKQNRIKKLT